MPEERKMVEVALYEDGTYIIEDTAPENAIQRMFGSRNGRNVDIYYYKSCCARLWIYARQKVRIKK